MIYLFLANGFEEIEAITTVDVLRRAGLNIKTVGVGGTVVTGSHGIAINADIDIDEIRYDDVKAVILPGGQPGTENLYASKRVCDCVNYCIKNNLTVCAICAAPTVLGRLGHLKGKKAVCYPGCEGQLYGADFQSCDGVCIDGNIITGRGPGRTIDFALTIVEQLKSKTERDNIWKAMQCKQEI